MSFFLIAEPKKPEEPIINTFSINITIYSKIYNDIVKYKTQEIIYFFYPGRAERLSFVNEISQEFFYSYLETKNIFKNTRLVEVSTVKNSFQKIMKFYDKVIFKLTRLQSDSEKYCDKKFSYYFKSKNVLVFTNFALGFSAIPFLLRNYFFNKRKVLVINSGLFSFRKASYFQKFFREIYLRLFFVLITNLIFTSKTEYEFACLNYKFYKNKFVLNEFCPDVSFWTKKNSLVKEPRKNILFVGNDEGRYFEILEPLAKKLIEYQFIFVSNNEIVTRIKLPNVKVFSAKWHSNDLSDFELQKIYQESIITILPIKNNLVASGQSVALQSMCNKTPVLITDTIGFWNKDLFLNKENILFVKDNTLASWEKQILFAINNENLLEKIKNNAFNLVTKKYTKNIFDEQFIKLLN